MSVCFPICRVCLYVYVLVLVWMGICVHPCEVFIYVGLCHTHMCLVPMLCVHACMMCFLSSECICVYFCLYGMCIYVYIYACTCGVYVCVCVKCVKIFLFLCVISVDMWNMYICVYVFVCTCGVCLCV